MRSRPLGAAVAALLATLAACSGAAATTTPSLRPGRGAPRRGALGHQARRRRPADQVASKLRATIEGARASRSSGPTSSGGPQTTEAFRANALDIGSVADIPPIHATWTGLDVKIVAARVPQGPDQPPDLPARHRARREGRALQDLRGKKIAYSPGQAQGALILRVLQKAGLDQGRRRAGRAAEHRRRLPERAGQPPGRRRADRRREHQALPRRSTARTARPRSRTGCATTRATSTSRPRRCRTRPRRRPSASTCSTGRRAQLWIDDAPGGVDRGLLRRAPGTHRRGRRVPRRRKRRARHPRRLGRRRSPGTRRPSTCWPRRPATPALDAEDLYDRRFESVAAEALRAG